MNRQDHCKLVRSITSRTRLPLYRHTKNQKEIPAGTPEGLIVIYEYLKSKLTNFTFEIIAAFEPPRYSGNLGNLGATSYSGSISYSSSWATNSEDDNVYKIIAHKKYIAWWKCHNIIKYNDGLLDCNGSILDIAHPNSLDEIIRILTTINN